MAAKRAALLVGAVIVAAAGAVIAFRMSRHAGSNRLDVRTVVLVTLDTFRADRLAAYGGPAELTPTLDRLAREGVRVDRCLTTAPITLPAHASILTGTDPPYHGARVNGAFRVGEDNPFLAEVLRQDGFRTGAFVSAFVLDRGFGLDRGFEVYDGPHSSKGAEPERDGETTVDAALAFVNSIGAAPAFVWVHLYDAHAPYTAPPAFRGKHASAYDDEIAYVDSCVARLLDGLARAGRADDALIAVTADHGEGLGEHDEATHTVYVYDSTLRVPCILWAKGRFPAGRVVADTRSTTAIAPTILELLGLDAPAAMYGRSFARELSRSNAPRSEPAIDDLVYFESEAPAYYYGFARLAGVEAGGAKLIVAPRPELYRPASDRSESVNLVESERAVADDLKRRLDDFLRRHDRHLHVERALSGADQAMLRQFGYVAPATTKDGRDPKDGARIVHALQDAQLSVDSDPARTIASLEELVKTEHGVAEAWELLGEAYARRGDAESAARRYATAVALRPNDPELRAKLGMALTGSNRPADAEAMFRSALELDPTFVKAMIALGSLHLMQNRVPDALAQFTRASATNPDDAQAHAGVATCLERARNIRAAAGEMERARAIDPSNPEYAYVLAHLYAQLDQREKSAEQLRDCQRLAPDGPHAAQIRELLGSD